MSLHRTPAEHDADPPSGWQVVKLANRAWVLRSPHQLGDLDYFTTKRAAEQAKISGKLVNLYNDEGRWFAGESVRGWKLYEGTS